MKPLEYKIKLKKLEIKKNLILKKLNLNKLKIELILQNMKQKINQSMQLDLCKVSRRMAREQSQKSTAIEAHLSNLKLNLENILKN